MIDTIGGLLQCINGARLLLNEAIPNLVSIEHKPTQLKLGAGPAEQCHNPIKTTSKVGF